MMKISKETFEWAQKAYCLDLREYLDDPAWVEAKTHIQMMRRVAKELNLDFDALLKELGSDFERRRVLKLEIGTYDGETE